MYMVMQVDTVCVGQLDTECVVSSQVINHKHDDIITATYRHALYGRSLSHELIASVWRHFSLTNRHCMLAEL